MASKEEVSEETGDKITLIPGTSRKRKSRLWLHKPKSNKYPKLEDRHSVSSSSATPKNLPSTAKPNSDKLIRAPFKARSKRKKLQGKRKLFTDSLNDQLMEITELLPIFLKKLHVAGIVHDFCLLIKLICEGKFPLNNISLLLLLDVARWFALDSTTKMTYRDDTLKFWKVLYRLFHGKALRFLSGMKSSGHVVTDQCERGNYSPQNSRINFAVPSRNIIAQYKPTQMHVPDEVPPGIIKDAIDMADETKSYVLSMDGKKLAPGLGRDSGDINLFGFEPSDSLESNKTRLSAELNVVEKASTQWSALSQDEQISILSDIVLIISKRIQDLRCLHVKQALALKRFEKEGGSDWRNSKYVYAISSTQALIHQLRGLVKRLLDINDSLLEIGSSICGTQSEFSDSGKIDAFLQRNWITLKEPEELPEECKNMSVYTKQRTPQWFDIRSTFPITGSRIFEGIGLDTLKKQQCHVQKLLHPNQTVQTFSETEKANMAHGVESEIHAIATLVGKVLPFYFPHHKYIEEGSHVILSEGKPLILVSPDGSIGQVDIGDRESCPRRTMACEFKCPVPAVYKPPVHYSLPIRYIPQVLGEMASMGVSELVYLSWTKESSTVFRVTFDEELWSLIRAEAQDLYLCDTIKKPTRLSEGAKFIKQKLGAFGDTHVKFLCEVSSLFGSSCSLSQTNDTSPYLFPVPTVSVPTNTVESVAPVMTAITSALQDVFQLCRKKATEVLVWLLSDTDREWNPEVPHAVPVAYAMKGYSLMTDTMRQMHNHVLQSCFDSGVDVACSCFDGQWIRLATRDSKEKPLTVLQLQRDVWEFATKTKRNEIVNELTKRNIVANINTDINVVKLASGMIQVSSMTLANMMASYKNSVVERNGVSLRNADMEKENTTDERNSTIECLPEDALDTMLQDENIINDLMQSGSQEEKEDTLPKTGTSLAEPEETLDSHTETDETHTETEELPAETDTNSDNANMIEDHASVTNTPVEENILVRILEMLALHEKVSVSRKWKDKSLTDLKDTIANSVSVHKLTHDEMNVILAETTDLQKSTGIIIRKSWKHCDKANAVCKLIGSGVEIHVEKYVKQVYTLRECAAKVVNANNTKIKKHNLNSVYAAFAFQEKYDAWVKDNPLLVNPEIENIGTVQWFSYPEYCDKRQRVEPKCLDAHHLLVNVRVKVCKDGVKNIRKEAWHAVAKSDSSIISKSLVIDLVDRQSNAFALRTFSEKVEQEMRRLGYDDEAEFCNIIRSWHEAEDEPGLSAVERAKRRLKLKSYLLNDVSFAEFPPHGMYIKGFPKVWFEGILQRIDTTIQLYSVVKCGTFNQISISSLVNETFFGELSDMEPTKLGCPKSVNIPRLMSTVTELMHYRCDPSERVFHMSTTIRSVYPKNPLSETIDAQPIDEDPCEMDSGVRPSTSIQHPSGAVHIRDHAFDRQQRRRKKRQSKRADISKLHAVARGCLPVRQHHKCDESKILPTTRLGIDLQ